MDKGLTQYTNEEWTNTAEELYEVNCQYEMLKKSKDELTKKLKMLSYNKTAFSGKYLFELSHRSGSVNYGAIPELLTVDLNKYRKDNVPVWKLRKIDFNSVAGQ